jgi:hypothetical protein
MRVSRRALGWGVFFVVVGIVALAVRAGWLEARLFADIGRLWPLVLVAIGVGLILERTAVGALGSILIGATFGLLVGGVLATGPAFGLGCATSATDASPGGPTPRTGSFAGAAGTVALHLACADLQVAAGPGSAWALNGITDRLRVQEAPDRLAIEPADGFFLPTGQGADRLIVTVPTTPVLDLSLVLDAGRLDADLAGARLSSLSATINAGTGRLALGGAQVQGMSLTLNAGDLGLVLPSSATQATVTVNAGQIKVCVPEGVGLRVTSSDVLASTTFGDGFSREGDAWVSPGWATAAQRIEMSVTVNVGAAHVSSGGCD